MIKSQDGWHQTGDLKEPNQEGLGQARQGSPGVRKSTLLHPHREARSTPSGTFKQTTPLPSCRKKSCNGDTEGLQGAWPGRRAPEHPEERERKLPGETAQKQYLTSNVIAARGEDNSSLHGATQQHWDEFLLWLITQQQGTECQGHWSSWACPGISPFRWIHVTSPTFFIIFLSRNMLLVILWEHSHSSPITSVPTPQLPLKVPRRYAVQNKRTHQTSTPPAL